VAGAKRQPTVGDMIRSLVIILVPVVVLSVLFTHHIADHSVTPVEWQPIVKIARTQAPYPVLAPVSLSQDWIPTRVSWTRRGDPGPTGAASPGNDWTLGFLSPDTIYFAVRQSDSPPAPFLADITRNGVEEGFSTVGDVTWQRFVSGDDRTRSLVLTRAKATTVVVADAPYAGLEAFAATLHG